ncbi:hypothetical protein PR048_006511 [Dryococelus australis]|uniref:Secreted protein n=1 Tax=Dryococelus australis TaxID=614101 RepID=A0ABQ9IB58_9NEOP|nr:hypothetical protein PR048_006511 [Dryococelus australis]
MTFACYVNLRLVLLVSLEVLIGERRSSILLIGEAILLACVAAVRYTYLTVSPLCCSFSACGEVLATLAKNRQCILPFHFITEDPFQQSVLDPPIPYALLLLNIYQTTPSTCVVPRWLSAVPSFVSTKPARITIAQELHVLSDVTRRHCLWRGVRRGSRAAGAQATRNIDHDDGRGDAFSFLATWQGRHRLWWFLAGRSQILDPRTSLLPDKMKLRYDHRWWIGDWAARARGGEKGETECVPNWFDPVVVLAINTVTRTPFLSWSRTSAAEGQFAFLWTFFGRSTLYC